ARRHNLPGDPPLVLAPAARTLFAAVGGETLPVVVDLGLVRAVDLERDRLAEAELGSAVDAHETLPVELDLHRHHRAGRTRPGGGAVAYAVGGNGVIGPKKHETGNGRVLRPAGRMTAVGNFPTGGALTRSGRYYWAVATGRGFNDIRIVNVHTHKVTQTLPIP